LPAVTDHPALHECLWAGILCNDSAIIEKDGQRSIAGDPTEGALLVAAEKAGLRHGVIHTDTPRVDMIPFESDYMYRATLHDHAKGRCIYKAGAFEQMLERCSHMLDKDGQLIPIQAEPIRAMAQGLSSQGMRIIAFQGEMPAMWLLLNMNMCVMA